MRTDGRRESDNVEDLRGGGSGGRGGGFGGGRVAAGGGVGIVIVLVIALLTGQDPSALLGRLGGGSSATEQAGRPTTVGDDELRRFAAVVLADTEQVFGERFRAVGKAYAEPTLILFSGAVDSACGSADAATGPFYCPADQKVYLDLSFFEELRSRFGAPGDFAAAYVIAHEVGHHVQNLLGYTRRVDRERGRVPEAEMNRLSVRLELQADYLAGVFAHHAERTLRVLEEGDVEEALRCAEAIGDDRLQRASRGRVVPDSFTHGTSAQRARWFLKGFRAGDLGGGDTFAVPYESL